MLLVKSLYKAGVAVVGLVGCASAFAFTTCNLYVNPVAFGAYNPLVYSDLDNDAGFVEVICIASTVPTPTVSYSLFLSAGLSGSVNPRKMQPVAGGPGAMLEYNLYSNISRQTIWDDNRSAPKVGGSVAFPQANVNYSGGQKSIYARIFQRQMNRSVGAYTDSIQVTVSY
jgi:spore coat protein U-like protein